ncbi:hypothetical protein Cgig2_003288 [Carnegiea gigantea]|uniref:Uncharacterized protein n=1 Tax=Carnegiea gigantea TaxID=171969 RepID=A0A9Q1JQA4_9CARY|nr:hypothetical protein Cgig2_003288 [Carnegiea gigantea]
MCFKVNYVVTAVTREFRSAGNEVCCSPNKSEGGIKENDIIIFSNARLPDSFIKNSWRDYQSLVKNNAKKFLCAFSLEFMIPRAIEGVIKGNELHQSTKLGEPELQSRYGHMGEDADSTIMIESSTKMNKLERDEKVITSTFISQPHLMAYAK